MRSSIVRTLIVPFLIIFLLGIHVAAVPPLPAEFYGTVSVDGKPAPIGTLISAQIKGVEKGSITTSVVGFYGGGPGIFDTRIKVNVTEEEYQPGDLKVVFMINGQQATQNAVFEPGSSKQLDLSTGTPGAAEQQTGSVVPSGTQTMVPGQTPTPSGAAEQQTGSIIPSGTPTIVPGQTPIPSGPTQTSSPRTGSITYGLDQPKTFKADDGLAELFFAMDTMLFSPDGQFLNAVGLRSRGITDLPPFPVNQTLRFTGYAYEIIPEGTYFNPKGVLSLKLPPGQAYDIINSGVVIYEYLPQTATWEPVQTSSNAFTNLITADIFEAAIYGLFVRTNTSQMVNNSVSQPSAPTESLNQDQSSNINTSNQTLIGPIITPHSIITPQEIITPSPSPEVTISQSPDTPVLTPEPSGTSQVQEPVIQPERTPLRIPGMNQISAVTSAIKSRLSGPVLIVLGFFAVIIVINIIVYAVYRYWWQQRARNG